MTGAVLDISVIICTYAEERWHHLVAAVASIQHQSTPPREIIVVVDHNPALLERVQVHIPGVLAIENSETRGLSGARNSGIAAAGEALIAFLDDDAIAEPDWLGWLSQCCADHRVLGAGGTVEPLWTSKRPGWFPEEFYWVVGCSYRGLPEARAVVRNPFGGWTCLREVFEVAGGFRNEIGRVGSRPLGCEETELCVRAKQHWSQQVFLYEPRARLHHCISTSRASWHYFRSRCYAEGLSKAVVAQYVGAKDGLASEHTYALRTLPKGVLRGLMDGLFRFDPAGFLRAGAIIAGLIITTAGYLVGTMSRLLVSSKVDYAPVRILELELSHPLPTISAVDDKTGQSYRRANCVVRLHTQPLGMVQLMLAKSELSPHEYVQPIWDTLHVQINEHLQQDGLPSSSGLDERGITSPRTPGCLEERERFLADAPFVSIIVPTRDRPERLQLCLRSLLSLHYSQYEIIIVDNAPGTNATADFIQRTYHDVPWVHYIREDRPGASCARNRGIMAARGEILAFTDDDVVVDPYWLIELVRAFGIADNVACVTGLTLPLELETPAQFWFEEHNGLSERFTRHIFDTVENHSQTPLYPYTTGQFGTGSSMAFRAAFLRSTGGFDPALGPGSPARAGEDLALFFQVVTRGYKLVYTPMSALYHLHRRDYTSLRQQIYGYGIGLTAYLLKNLLDNPRILFDLVTKVPYGLYFSLSSRSPLNRKKSIHYPKDLTMVELKGMLYGPFAYLRSRWAMRDARKAFAPVETAITPPVKKEALVLRYDAHEHEKGVYPNGGERVEGG